jgi:hypothetical protein
MYVLYGATRLFEYLGQRVRHNACITHCLGLFFRRDKKVFGLRCYRTLTGMVMVTASFFSFLFKRVCHFVLLSSLSSLNNTLLIDMASQPQSQPGRFKRFLGGGSGGKHLSHRLSLNTSTTFLSGSNNQSSDEGNRRQSLNLFSLTSSPVSSKSSARSTVDTDSGLEFMSQPYESTSSAESPSITLNGVAPAPQKNYPARPQSSLSFRKHSNSSFHQLLPSISSSSLEVMQSPSSIEPMHAIPENDTIPSPSQPKTNSSSLRKNDGDRKYPSLQLTASHKLDSSKRSLSASNLRSESAPEPAHTEKPSSLFGARKRISALLPESWQSETTRSRTLTMSSMSHSSDNETSASESPPMTPANAGAQFMREAEDEVHEFRLPHHKPITPLSHDWMLKKDEYFTKEQISPCAQPPPQPILTHDQNGNQPQADKQVVPPMPFLNRAQSTRSFRSQDEWSFAKQPVNQYLAEQVRLVLGSALSEADMEIEQEWETHRENERKNSMPTGNYARAVGGLA